jgi:flagellar basal-body rod modification protein FlgD
MPVSAINSTATNPTQSVTGGQTLNQADFLKLLVTQMTSQDPLNPQSDTAFAAQLAQFSALQQSQGMASDMQSLQANSLIGRTVSVTPSADSTQQDTGVVSGIQIASGQPQILVNGQLYSLNQITAIAPTAPAATTTP